MTQKVLVDRNLLEDIQAFFDTLSERLENCDFREVFSASDELQAKLNPVLDANPPLSMSMFASVEDYERACNHPTR